MSTPGSTGVQTVEYDPTAGGAGARLRLRRRRRGVYVLTAHTLGPEVGSLVADGDGYVITLGDRTGTGLAVRVGSVTTIR